MGGLEKAGGGGSSSTDLDVPAGHIIAPALSDDATPTFAFNRLRVLHLIDVSNIIFYIDYGCRRAAHWSAVQATLHTRTHALSYTSTTEKFTGSVYGIPRIHHNAPDHMADDRAYQAFRDAGMTGENKLRCPYQVGTRQQLLCHFPRHINLFLGCL